MVLVVLPVPIVIGILVGIPSLPLMWPLAPVIPPVSSRSQWGGGCWGVSAWLWLWSLPCCGDVGVSTHYPPCEQLLTVVGGCLCWLLLMGCVGIVGIAT